MKKKNDKIHYKKIQIKQMKNENTEFQDINMNNKNEIINFPQEKRNKIFMNPQMNIINKNQIKFKNQNKKEQYEDNDNFNLDDINNQLDEILENIELDGIDEINKKIKYLGEDKKMLNTVSYTDDKYNNSLYKKIDNKNKKKYERNKMYLNTEGINNHNRYYHNKNITNNRYLFTNANNNTYRYWKEENNCFDDEEEDDYFNKTNISLFYKYNKFTNYNKSNNYYE
jgi:hypothetical protein